MIVTREYPSPLGMLRLAAEEKALVELRLPQSLAGMPGRPDDGSHPVLRAAADWLDRYFAGERPGTDELSLAPRGTAFQQAVWRRLAAIPYGAAVTYGELAAVLAQERGLQRMSPQAVGGAVGANPISIVIPCHRVLGVGGRLTGYNGGLEQKRRLLTHEGIHFAQE